MATTKPAAKKAPRAKPSTAAKKAPAKRSTGTRRRPTRRKPPDGPVVKAVKKDLAAIRKRDKALADSTEAATAIELAKQLDSARNSATSKSMCARSLAEAMEKLRSLLPPEESKDQLDDLTARRERRLAKRSQS